MKVKKLIQLFIPKYYNRLTRIMIVGGITLISKPIWVDILNLFLEGFKFSIIGEFDWLLGLVIIIIALIYNSYHRKLDLDHEIKSKPAFKKVQYLRFENFGTLCQEILPILKDNEYIFNNTGPNSGMNNSEPLRMDLTIWNKLKKKAILPNNKAIKKLIKTNLNLIPESHKDIFNKMLLHIDAFNEHIKNPNFDYSEYQFPSRFSEIVLNESFQFAKTNKELLKKYKWIKNNIEDKYISDWIIFGSIIYTPEKANDVDLAILLNNENDNQISNYIEKLKSNFKNKFKKELHISVFKNTEISHFDIFLAKNPFKIKK